MDYETIKNLISTPYWKQVEQYLDHLEGLEKEKLSTSVDQIDIYRTQGAIKMLKYLKKLRENYVK